MIWKELREIGRWAALAFVGLLLAELFALHTQGRTVHSDVEGLTLGGETFLLVSALGCAAVGGLLGALQILPEMRRDRWATLLHRPVSRGRILAGKAVTGVLLCTAATGLSLLLSVLFVAWPRQFGVPFVPRLVLPGLSDLLLAIAFYFAALLIGLLPAERWAQRAAVVFGALAILVLHVSESSLFSIALCGVGLFAIAAWGAMDESGLRHHQLGRAALVLLVFLGTHLLWVLLLMGLAALPPRPEYRSRVGLVDLRILEDGTVLYATQEEGGRVTLRDAEGKVVANLGPEEAGEQSRDVSLANLVSLDQDRGDNIEKYYRRSSRPALQTVSTSYDASETWFLLPQGNYFVGYDQVSRRCVGICDRDGFKGPNASLHSFPEPLVQTFNSRAPNLYWSKTRLYDFDFPGRRLTLLLETAGETIHGASSFPARDTPRGVTIAVGSEIRLVDNTGAHLVTLPYRHDLGEFPNISFGCTADLSRLFVHYQPSSARMFEVRPAAVHLDALDRQGKLLQSYTIPNANFWELLPSWGKKVGRVMQMPLQTFARTLWSRHYGSLEEYESVPLRGPSDLKDHELTALLGFAVVCAAAAAAWGHWSGLGKRATVLWSLISLALGVAGLVAFRLLVRWPNRIRCPVCGHARPVRASTCPHCDAAWAPAPLTGSEIFEPV